MWLAYEIKSLLIGESAAPGVVEGIRRIVADKPAVQRVNEILTLHMGPDFVLLTVSVEFQDSRTANDLEQSIARMTREIKDAFPEVKRVFIEAEEAARPKPPLD